MSKTTPAVTVAPNVVVVRVAPPPELDSDDSDEHDDMLDVKDDIFEAPDAFLLSGKLSVKPVTESAAAYFKSLLDGERAMLWCSLQGQRTKGVDGVYDAVNGTMKSCCVWSR